MIDMATPGWLRRALTTSGGFVCAAVAIWYSPMLTAASWRTFHPSGQLDYRGLHITVPWLWTSDFDRIQDETTVSPQGVYLRRSRRNLGQAGEEAMFVTVISPDPGVSADQQTRNWIEAFRTAHPGREFDAKTPLDLPSGTSCLSGFGNEEPRVVCTCISLQDGWVANYEGGPADLQVFFRVVAKLKQ